MSTTIFIISNNIRLVDFHFPKHVRTQYQMEYINIRDMDYRIRGIRGALAIVLLNGGWPKELIDRARAQEITLLKVVEPWA